MKHLATFKSFESLNDADWMESDKLVAVDDMLGVFDDGSLRMTPLEVKKIENYAKAQKLQFGVTKNDNPYVEINAKFRDIVLIRFTFTKTDWDETPITLRKQNIDYNGKMKKQTLVRRLPTVDDALKFLTQKLNSKHFKEKEMVGK